MQKNQNKTQRQKENVIYPGVDTVRPPHPSTVKAPFIEILSIDPRERRITKVKFLCLLFAFANFLFTFASAKSKHENFTFVILLSFVMHNQLCLCWFRAVCERATTQNTYYICLSIRLLFPLNLTTPITLRDELLQKCQCLRCATSLGKRSLSQTCRVRELAQDIYYMLVRQSCAYGY